MGRASFIILIALAAIVAWPQLLKFIYPTPHRETVLRVADRFRLEPALVYAVLFEESHFDERAKSHKGALGLMQIVPETGEFIAKSLGYPSFKADDLYDPTLNITFGSWYLSFLKDRLDDEYQALIAYNGGEGAVKQATPPKESQTFAERVKATKAIYHDLYGSEFVPADATPD